MQSFIKSIGTAVPENKNSQRELATFMAKASAMNEEEALRLSLLYKASGIQTRYSVLEDFGKENGKFNFFPNTPDLEPFPTVGDRMRVYEREAMPLALKAIKNCIESLENDSLIDVTHLITVSCTGMYAPGIDIELVEQLSLNPSVQRTSINFMGCYAAFNGLKVADAIARSTPNAKILMVCVELCTLHYQKSKDWDQLLSNALFSDGAAAVLIDNEPPVNGFALSLEQFYCGLASEGKLDMAWRINDFGFDMVLSSYVPSLIQKGIGKLCQELLEKINRTPTEIDYYAIHPGGKKILEVIEETLGVEKNKNSHAYEVLRNYGNMSSPTVLFVLKSILDKLKEEEGGKSIVSFAFGPGLTLESCLLRVVEAKVKKKKEEEFLIVASNPLFQ